MTLELRWAARYTFVDELWRGRARVLVDPDLEAVLYERGRGRAHGEDGNNEHGYNEHGHSEHGHSEHAESELLEALLPSDPDLGEAVWMAVSTADVAAELGRWRPGTTFVPRDAIADVIARAHWDVALIDLTPELRAAGGRAQTTAAHDEDVHARSAAAALDALSLAGAAQGRSVVLAVPVRETPRGHGLEYGELADLCEASFGGGRLFGLFAPAMAAVVDFGDLGDGDGDGDGDGGDDVVTELHGGAVSAQDVAFDDEVALTFDNTLGSQEPALLEYIAITGDSAVLGDGMSLIELPEVTASGEASEALKHARRRADLAVRDSAALRQELTTAREELGSRSATFVHVRSVHEDSQRDQALESALAREQALKWRVGQLEAELSQAMARPVEALEAEVARLRAELAAGPEAQGTQSPSDVEILHSAEVQSTAETTPVTEVAATATQPPEAVTPQIARNRQAGGACVPGTGRNPKALARVLEGLVGRVERGGIGTLELRKELLALRLRVLRRLD